MSRPNPIVLRHQVQHQVGNVLAFFSRLMRQTPPGHWLHRRLRHGLEITSTDVAFTNGSADFGPLEIVFLSDLHAGAFMGADDLCDLAERVNALQPDMVCFGGDLVDGRHEEIHYYEEALRRLEAPLGVFAVLGNHEYFQKGQAEHCLDFLEAQGVQTLHNRGVRVQVGEESLWLAGVDDLREGRPDLAAAFEGRREGEATVLLSHHPDVFLDASQHAVDLQLSGHTHGGQLRLGDWIPLKHSRHGFLSGLHRREESALYVSRGVGTTVLPLRVGVPAEVAVLRIG